MLRSASRRTLEILLAGALYVVSANVGLPDPLLTPGVGTLSLTAGIALAAMLLIGPTVAPAIFAGGVVIGLMRGLDLPSALGIAAGNTVAPLAGAWLAERFARGIRAFERPVHVCVFAAIAIFGVAPLAGFLGAATLVATGRIASTDAPTALVSRWLAGIAGDLLVAPLVTLWVLRPRLRLARRRGERRAAARGWQAWLRPRAIEAWSFAVVAGVSGGLMFDGWLPGIDRALPVMVLLFPILSWCALRFGARETSTALAWFAGIAIWGTLHGRGPFTQGGDVHHWWTLQVFLSATTVTALALASTVDERNRVDSELHVLAVTDPLTGLANYRHLTSSIEREIGRARRARESFGVLLLDVDNLKVVNDQLGHNVGSRLLVRLANVLRGSCRVTDLIARYGGDEFAVLLPGCDEEAARAQLARVQAGVAADPDTPPISVSIGIAIFPKDGETCDELLDRADSELYGMKSRTRRRPVAG